MVSGNPEGHGGRRPRPSPSGPRPVPRLGPILVARRAVDCTPKGRDKFNRTLALCRTSATQDLGEALVREGLAVNFGVGDRPGPYEAAQEDAQAAKRGMWRGTFQQPSEWRQAHPRDGN